MLGIQLGNHAKPVDRDTHIMWAVIACGGLMNFCIFVIIIATNKHWEKGFCDIL